MIEIKPATLKSLKRGCLFVVISAFVLLLIVVAAVYYALSYHSMEQKYARSKPAFEAFAAQVMATDPATPITLPRHLGEFDVGDPHRLPHGFFFGADYGHPLDWNGFAYSTDPLPEEMDDPVGNHQTMFCHPIEGNWYSVWRN